MGDESGRRWIVVPNWHELQHYVDRDPTWIKLYRGLASNPDWKNLSGHRRAVLVGIWLEYASSDGQLHLDTRSYNSRTTLDTRSLSSRITLRVTSDDLKALTDAEFLAFSASRPLALRYQAASPEKRREEKKPPSPPSGKPPRTPAKTARIDCQAPGCETSFTLEQDRLAHYRVWHPELLPSEEQDA